MAFDVKFLREQHVRCQADIHRATLRAAEAIGQRAEMTAKAASPGKTYQMRGGWKHRCWQTIGAVHGELTNDVKHALFVERGTGLYGPKHAKYPIVPRRKNWLSWAKGGARYFAKRVMHPGIKPRFIGRAAMTGGTSIFIAEGHDRNVATIERELSRVA